MPNIVLIVILLIALNFPWWVYLSVALLYALWQPSYGLFVIAFIIDVMYGAGVSTIPFFYTLITALIVGSSEILKPYMRYYK